MTLVFVEVDSRHAEETLSLNATINSAQLNPCTCTCVDPELRLNQAIYTCIIKAFAISIPD